MNKFSISFAAPIGAGKSPIANYLSYKLNLPVFSNDLIRTEVQEDMLEMNAVEYERRRSARLQDIITSNLSFIYDASVDRQWPKLKTLLKDNGYSFLIISLDFSKEKLTEIYRAKGYTAFRALDETFAAHQKFIEEFKEDVLVNIDDARFSDRVTLALSSLRQAISA